jgi:DNA-binding MarR family transcriptional regulator
MRLAGDGGLADRLHSAAIHVLRFARQDDAVAGVSAARLSVLAVLVYGSARTVTELAAAEQVAVPTMTRLLQGLEQDGHVRRRRDRGDQRVVRVSATARGRRALEAGRRARLARLASLLEGFTAQERKHAAVVLAALQRELGAAVSG